MKVFVLALVLSFLSATLYAKDRCDFNGDGYEDLAIGVQEAFENSQDYGYVHVLYGTDRGLSATNTQVWHRAVPGIPGDPTFGQFFGAAVACGNFNGDNYADLAIHINSGGPESRGQILILRGSSSGLTATGNQLWTPTSPGITGVNSFFEQMASGDFNGDRYSDLAIQAEPSNLRGNEGGVFVLYGSSSGLSTAKLQLWTQATSGIADAPESGDFFGSALVVGNFGKDGSTRCYDDLAISVSENFPHPIPDEEEPNMDLVGAVHVIYGSSNGLTATGSQYFHQDITGMPDTNEELDQWGFDLAAGAFRGTASACGSVLSDLAIGAPGENGKAGAVQVLYAKTTGLTTDGNQRWTQNTTNVTDASERGDLFGLALAAGRASNGRYYLAIGSPGESIGTIAFAGIVQVLFSDNTTRKLTATGMKTYNQKTSGIADSAEGGDQFGITLSTGNFNNFGTEELVIAATGENLTGTQGQGTVHVLHGADTATTQFWNQASSGIPDSPEISDFFGHVLSD